MRRTKLSALLLPFLVLLLCSVQRVSTVPTVASIELSRSVGLTWESTNDPLRRRQGTSEETATDTTGNGRQRVGGPNPGACGYIGDSDTYGLGIRIGIYTQWASNVIANWYVQEMAHTMRVRATLFQMAMATALAFITTHKPRPHAVDALILIVILLGGVSSWTSHVLKPRVWKHTSMGGKLRFMIYFVLSMYATWFWWIGYTKFAKVPFDDSCEDKNSYGFMFHRVKLTENWYLKTNFAFGAAGSVIFGAIFVGYIFHYYDAMIRDLREAITSQTHPVAGEAGGLLAGETGGGMGAGGGALAKEKEPIGSREPNPPWWKPFLAGSIMAVTIASVESIILWNGIKGVNSILSTGQLIPFVIGIGGLLKICFRWWQVSRAWKNVLVIVDILDGPDKGVR